jgi:hypothetical protein
MARSAVKVKNRDPTAGAEPAQKCGSDHASATRERPQLRCRRAVLAAQQFGEDVAGGRVIADQLWAEPFGGQQEVDRGRVLPGHGVRANPGPG